MPVGTLLKVKLTIGGGMDTHLCGGRVAWANAYDPVSPFSFPLGMGVLFTDLNGELKERVNRMVMKTAEAKRVPPPAAT
jgi:hypothetical protein